MGSLLPLTPETIKLMPIREPTIEANKMEINPKPGPKAAPITAASFISPPPMLPLEIIPTNNNKPKQRATPKAA